MGFRSLSHEESMSNATARVLLSALRVISSQSLAAQTRTVSLVTSDWEPFIGETLPGEGCVNTKLCIPLSPGKPLDASVSCRP